MSGRAGQPADEQGSLSGWGGGRLQLVTLWSPLTVVTVCSSGIDTVAQVRRVHQSVATEGPSR